MYQVLYEKFTEFSSNINFQILFHQRIHKTLIKKINRKKREQEKVYNQRI